MVQGLLASFHLIPQDTAQNYLNEVEAGIAIRESGLARDEIFITTKYSGLNELDIPTSIRDSLRNVSFLDMFVTEISYMLTFSSWESLMWIFTLFMVHRY